MIQIYNNKHLTWDGTTSVNYYEFFADTVTDLPSDPYYFSSEKGRYKIAQGSIAWIIDVSEIYMFNSSGAWVLETISGGGGGGTITSITASNGLKTASGSAITDTGDIQANLASTTALSGDTIYNVGLNSNGNLAVKVPTVSKTAVGLTPQLPNESSTTKFLRQDGSWEVPAYTTVAEGSANGTVKVNGTDVSVHGLGTAAYTASSAYATSTQGGKADTAIQSAGTGLSKSGTTLNHSNSVTAKTAQGFAQIAYDAQGHITGSTAATTAQTNAIDSGITSTDVAQIATNKNAIDGQQNTTASGGNGYALINGIRLYVSSTAPTGNIPDGSVGVGW